MSHKAKSTYVFVSGGRRAGMTTAAAAARAGLYDPALENRIEAEVYARMQRLSCLADFERAAGILDRDAFWLSDRFKTTTPAGFRTVDRDAVIAELKRLARNRIKTDVRREFTTATTGA